MQSQPKKIDPRDGGIWGIVGGTFNPIHLGHLILAESIRQACHAAGMVFVPAQKHPLKPADELEATYRDRAAMIDLAIASNDRFVQEMPAVDSGFTIDLVTYLRQKYQVADFFLTVGSDIISEFGCWHRHAELQQMIKIVIAARPGFPFGDSADSMLKGVERVLIPQYDISASDIRSRVRSHLSIKYMVAETVEAYIAEHGLYVK